MDAVEPSGLRDDLGGSGGVLARLPAVVWEAEALDKGMTFVSQRARDLLGHDPDTWRDTPRFWQDHLHPDDRGRVLAAVQRGIEAGGGTVRIRYRFRASDDAYRRFQDTITIRATPGSGFRLSGLMLDVTDEQGELESVAAGTVVENALAARSGPMHETIVDNLQDGVYYVDTERRISYWNRGAEHLTGFRAEQVVGRHCFDNILCHVNSSGANLCMRGCPLEATMRDGESRSVVVWLRHADGSRRPVQVRTATIRAPEGKVVGGVEIFSDATGLIEAEEAVEAARRDALTDPLTGLPNRRLLDAVLESRREDLERHGRSFGLLIADVDHFKRVNDRFGHDVGDGALRIVAATLRGGVRGGDSLVRWGGEEFAVVAAIRGEASIWRLANRLLALMRAARMQVDGEDVALRVSIGGAIAGSGETLEHLFARADRALLDAKEAGRDRFVLGAPAVASEVDGDT